MFRYVFKMKYQSCLLKCKLINDKECIWNGTMLQDGGHCFVITTISTLLLSLPCKNLRLSLSKDLNDFSSFLISSYAWIQSSDSIHDLVKLPANLHWSWKSQHFKRVIKKVRFSSEMLPNDNSRCNTEDKACCDLHSDDELLSWFGLFTIRNYDFSFTSISKVYCNLSQGMTVWASSYPFGDLDHTAFHNCLSKGILCNVIDNIFLLIDACCLPGSHGALVYEKTLLPVGIVVCPLELTTGQLSGMTIVCSWKEICSLLIQSALSCSNPISKPGFNKCSGHSSYLSRSVEVVSLKHTIGWGSGVIVVIDKLNKKLLIATCRHVVEPANDKMLQANIFCGSKIHVSAPAKVIYSTAKDSWLDFALLEVDCDQMLLSQVLFKMHNYCVKIGHIYALSFAQCYHKGTSLLAKGCCIFDSSSFMPSLTKGILSNVVFPNDDMQLQINSPVLLHSTCTVLSGISGGGVFSSKNWLFYGLIVNNVKIGFENHKEILYQNVNFVLPASLFMPSVLSFALKRSSFSALHSISCKTDLKRLWLLNTESVCASKL